MTTASNLLHKGERYTDGQPRLVGGTRVAARDLTGSKLVQNADGAIDCVSVTIPAGTTVIGGSHWECEAFLGGSWVVVSWIKLTPDEERKPGHPGQIPVHWHAAEDSVGIGPLGVRWDVIHAACRAIDEARRGSDIGRVQCADAFGGSYHGPYYEERAIAGLVRLSVSADTFADQAWTIVHSCRRGDKAPRDLRAALRVAVALHDLKVELARVGIIEYDPGQVICGLSDRGLAVTGLRWLAGHDREPDAPVPMAAVRAYIDGRMDEFRAAMQ